MSMRLANLPFLALALTLAPVAQAQRCKSVHADLVEVASTEGCNPGLSSCFLGELDGNHGLRGTTHFNGDSGAAGPATSPGFISYSGPFEYRTPRGTIRARSTGVTNPEVVTEYQQVLEGDGDFAGVTGHFFVSGHKLGNGVIETRVRGELCRQR